MLRHLKSKIEIKKINCILYRWWESIKKYKASCIKIEVFKKY